MTTDKNLASVLLTRSRREGVSHAQAMPMEFHLNPLQELALVAGFWIQSITERSKTEITRQFARSWMASRKPGTVNGKRCSPRCSRRSVYRSLSGSAPATGSWCLR